MSSELSPVLLAELAKLDTCLVANAIDTFGQRLRNEGYVNSSVRCLFPKQAPMVGYAATLKVRGSSPPIEGRTYAPRTDWWKHILAMPTPRIAVLEDVDSPAGSGSFVGEIHAQILKALGCVGVVTNGAVRDLPAVEAMPFQFFAGGVAVSHSYTHIVEIGTEVVIGGLKIKPGDLLHGDQHGVLSVPAAMADRIPPAAAKLIEQEAKIIALCHAGNFTLEELDAAVKGLDKKTS